MILPLVERSWTSFFVGSGIAFFPAISWIGYSTASAVCSASMWTALFGPGALATNTAACVAAGAISVLAGAVASGLATLGATQGWVFEGKGANLGERNVYAPLINTKFGLAHHYDAATHQNLNSTFGAMLDKHNTTLLHVTWIETLTNGNYTNSPFHGLNMTQGRVIALNDNGIIRTAIGHTDTLPQILEGFNDFKTSNVTVPAKRGKRDTETVNWMSFNTYGENMSEGSLYEESLDEDANASATSADYGVDGWVESFDYYSSKFCLGASPPGEGQGQDSIIVGEVYTNAYGGVDSFCDSA